MAYKKLSLSFDSLWVLSKKDEDVLPVEAIIELLKDKLDMEVIYSNFTDCELLIKSEEADSDTIKATVENILKEKFLIDENSDVVDISVTDYEKGAEKQEETDDKASETKSVLSTIENTKPDDSYKAVMEKINALIGAVEFKALAEECVKLAPGIKKYNTFEVFNHQSYIFSINDGNGLTTYLELFAELLESLGLFEFGSKDKVVEEKLQPPQSKEGLGNPFSSVLSHFQSFTKKGKIICIDISEWMTKTGEKAFKDFLSVIDDNSGKNIIVFRVPFVEKEILKALMLSLGDMLFIRDVSFIPFDNVELTECAKKSLEERGFTVEDDAWEIYHARITEEKNDGRFYGINTVNKVIREMIYRKQLHNAINDVDDTVVKRCEILSLASSFEEDDKTGLEMLDDYIGMSALKQRVQEIVAQIEMAQKNSKLGHPCIHMRFVGNPGTGKTTVARVIGKILKEKGILRNGNFFEYAGRDFCGRYVGETAPKTSAMCRDAYGSVMFVDEAYSLYHGDSFSNADYGREAIDTLIAEMENHRSDLVIIMAGYPDEMSNLMKSNPGLESRMPYVIEFNNYSREQLFEIFMLMAKRNFAYDNDFEESVKDYFESLPDEVVESKEFSNARFVRNLFERTWGKAVLRAQMNKTECDVLIKEDFLVASSENEFKKIINKPSAKLGFI